MGGAETWRLLGLRRGGLGVWSLEVGGSGGWGVWSLEVAWAEAWSNAATALRSIGSLQFHLIFIFRSLGTDTVQTHLSECFQGEY